MRRVKVPKNLHHLPPLGVVVSVFPIEFLKMYITQKKNILQVRSFSLSLRKRAKMQRGKFTSLHCSRSNDRLGPGSLTVIGAGEG